MKTSIFAEDHVAGMENFKNFTGSGYQLESDLVFFGSIHGEPTSKQRPRYSSRTKTFYTPSETRIYEDLIGYHVGQKVKSLDRFSHYSVRIVFFTGSEHRKDIDNLCKAVLDGCTKVVWADDSQVIELYARLIKSDKRPRTELTIFKSKKETPIKK